MSALSSAASATHTTLTDCTHYREIFQVSPIEAIPDTHDLIVCSQLDTSRNPKSRHIRYRIAIDTAGLERLHQALGQYLQAMTAQGSNVGGLQ